MLILIVLLGGTLSAGGQTAVERFFAKYNFHFITEKDGLPNCFVDDIIQDSEGFVWAATHQGIVRYDGYQMLHLHSQAGPVRLKSDFVRKLCEDNRKRLWVASEGGIDLIDLRTYAPAPLELPPDSALRRLMSESVHTLYKDREGCLWIAASGGLWCLEPDGGDGIADYHWLEGSGASVRALAEVDGAVCAGVGNEVCRLVRQEPHRLVAVPLSDSLPPFSEDWRISCMQTDGRLLWIGSNRGLFRYDPDTRSLKRYRYSTHRPGMLSQAYITDIKLTRQGHLIVSTLNGVNVYQRETDTFAFIRQDGASPYASVNCNAIDCVFTAGETIWLGTETGGINLLSPKRLRTELWHNPWEREGKSIPVNAICQDSDGNIWAALMEHGLACWNPSAEETACYRFSPDDLTSISNNTLNGLLADSHRHLWAYTWGVGINELAPEGRAEGRFRRYTREEVPTLKGDFISSACEDTLNGGIWFGSTRGLLFYDRRTGTFDRALLDGQNNEFDAIQALLADRRGRLWAGTTQGVFVIDLRSFAKSRRHFGYTLLKYKLDHPESLRMEKINVLLESRDGTIWLGGNGDGLYRLDEGGGSRFRFLNYTTRDGLPDNTVTGLAEDGAGCLWVVTTDGVARMDPANGTFACYTSEDGLPVMPYYRNAICYSGRYDRLFLGTAAGLLAVTPDSGADSLAEPRVRLSSLTVAGNPVFPASGDFLEQDISTAEAIRLHERESRFSVALTTMNYGNSGRIRYMYRLKGYESEWNETPPGSPVARYTAVPAGNYVLQVKATDESGRWSGHLAELKVRVVPYFYKTPWFIASAVVLSLLAVQLFYLRKMKRYARQKAELKRMVDERTRELALRNEQLELMARHVEEVTEEKISFFTNITHEFRTPVTLIHGPIGHALKVVTDPDVKAQLEIAGRNSDYLLSLVNELLDFRKLEADRVVLDVKPCNMEAFLTGLLLPFKVFARERGIGLAAHYRLQDHPCLMLDMPYMRKVMINLVSNAIKFTPDSGRIDIYVAAVKGNSGGDLLYINVCDTGYGIAEEDMARIFDSFYQSRRGRAREAGVQGGTGIGLFLCRKIVNLHGGRIFARNNPGRGASLRILIPLVPAAAPLPAAGAVEELPAAGTPQEPAATGQKRDTILVADDNRDMRAYIASLLGKDYRLLEAADGQEALRLLQEHTVSLIVSDLMMPVMDGMELSRRVKENLATSHIPFLMLTAVRSEAQEKRSFEIGVDEYLCKPFDEEVLLFRVRNILEMQAKYRRLFSAGSRVEDIPVREESRDHRFLTRAAELMKENYADPEYNLDCFVRDMGYSKTLVNNKMQALAGQPIGQFMKNYRLNVARQMIQEGAAGVNVSEVAYAVGFNDPKYFTKCFKELFGCLPSSILKK